MLILLTIVFLVLLIVAANKDWDSAGSFCTIGFGVCLVAIVVLSWSIVSGYTLESKNKYVYGRKSKYRRRYEYSSRAVHEL